MAFHPYPQLIRAVFILLRFGPPRNFTCASSWPWVDHLVSGLIHATQSPYSDSLSLRLRGFLHLTSLHRLTRRIIMQKARGQPEGLPLLVSKWFQVLFHSPPGVLFTFPSRYWFAIGRQGVFSLGRWSSQIPTGFLVSRGTRVRRRESLSFRLQDFHLLWSTVPDRSAKIEICNSLTVHTSVGRAPQPRKSNAYGLLHSSGLG